MYVQPCELRVPKQPEALSTSAQPLDANPIIGRRLLRKKAPAHRHGMAYTVLPASPHPALQMVGKTLALVTNLALLPHALF